MSMPVGNQQGAGQQQNNGQQGQQGANDAGQGQQQNAGQGVAGGDGSLIASAAEGQQDPAGQQGAGQGQQQGQGQQGGVTLESLAAQLASMQQTYTSELDRRINQVAATLRGEFGQRGQQAQGQQQNGQGQQGQGDAGQQQNRNGQGQFAAPPAGPDPADVREARSVCRDAFNDGFRFVDPAERQLAMSLAHSEIGQRLSQGADPDTAGTQAAASAVEQIKKLRGTYEAATLATLRAQGRLVDTAGTAQRVAGMPITAGVNTGGTGQPNPQGAFQQGSQLAQQLQQSGQLTAPRK